MATGPYRLAKLESHRIAICLWVEESLTHHFRNLEDLAVEIFDEEI